nr:GNAT family N-acetyltransferase [Flexivirga aerilata]
MERFERDNRAFFAARIGDRGDGFFERFDELLAERVDENRCGTSLLCVLVLDDEIVGRVNVLDLDRPDGAELGYRVAEHAQGRGLATAGVTDALAAASARGVRTVTARVFVDNTASRRVLEHCDFEPTGPVPSPDGSPREFVGYRRQLPPP